MQLFAYQNKQTNKQRGPIGLQNKKQKQNKKPNRKNWQIVNF